MGGTSTRLLGTLLLLTLPWMAWATTTSGATLRNLNVTDGIVNLGALPGTNGASWETDEFFEGFQGAVNWYLTWDDNNLYLGRIGGNNAEGSIIYLQATYPGAVNANRGFNYNQLEPLFTPMGGVNFVGFFKNTYSETRTYNGVWSAPSTTITPAFSTQGNGANMEVAIPWSMISGGNGRPSSIRFVLYQVAPAGTVCPNEFVYGESPWGTGNVGDGPSIGVNDGIPVSLRQPGGCNVGDSTAKRWWGCFPVIGDLSANTWDFNFGRVVQDTQVCRGAGVLPLVANQGQGTGTWVQVSGPAPALILDTLPAASSVTGLDDPGLYGFVFTYTTSTCYTSHDTVYMHVVAPANAFLPADTIICEGTTICVTPSNLAALGTLAWSTGSMNDTLCISLGGDYSFTSTDTNGCAVADTMIVFWDAIPLIMGVSVDDSQCPVLQFSAAVLGSPSSYDWDLGNGIHLSTSNPTFDYTSWGNGTYAYVLTVQDDCGIDIATGTVAINCIVGVGEAVRPMPSVYPNPNQGRFFVDSGALGEPLEKASLMDPMGRLVWEMSADANWQKTVAIDVAHLPSGTYILQCEVAGKIDYRKIQVTR